ncbi:sigma-B regulation protein RsbU (phosphoserine phosphatase) [Catalinimonas alkaloidigena]|uniref:GAF domain-containing SpoIIE family protein phosphatase n=1 Tax=Catalinimonas alkaloidigena TaxID=1075417 RepID=UPI0024066F31|nr:GAF domain-containing SpoIIE family protein phosphatase [Catalinimonas alkaloidigena]MDF9799853.1 sigma-B regulation protein RsbU (phosphoserine phosphatase) [Catalinimonas alkaloidigena]
MRFHKNVIRFTLFLGIISWILLVVTDLSLLFADINNIRPGIPAETRLVLLNLFFIALFFYYRYITGRAERINFIDLLWRVFATGLLATIVALTIVLFYNLLGDSRLSQNIFLRTFFYHINIGLVTAFLTSTIMVWKQLILYQKSKRLIRLWQMFEYALLASIILNFFPIVEFNIIYNIILALLLILGLVLSINLKWVAYLDFKQKWKSIIIMLAISIFLVLFLNNLYSFGQTFDNLYESPLLPINILDVAFILALFGFTFVYNIFSLLVILFNLPTSSVFEQKLEEVINFQRLSQSTQAGYKVDQIFEILLESSVKAVFADAAWVETDDFEQHILLTRGVEEEEIPLLKEKLKGDALQSDGTKGLSKPRLSRKDYRSHRKKHRLLQLPEYKSVLWIPLVVKNNTIGTLVVLKEVSDGFNKEMVSIIGTFASQACISVENFQLLNETIENERYKEELEIANRVHQSLLPKEPVSNEVFEIAAFSEAADQVGGDYYDIYQINEHKFIIIIGDVSGKGTSAAFNMAQMKGVFHSLAQLDLSPDKFLAYANSALSRCLEKTSFITASFFVVDTLQSTIEFARAGHCPTLYYSATNQSVTYLENQGLGLGIIRNEKFNQYIEVTKVNYSPGDIVMLYTDGITEAANSANEQFGYERLQLFLGEHATEDPKVIQEALLKNIFAFCEGHALDDDYTALIIKFK